MITHVLFPVAFRVHCRQQIVLVAVRAQNVPIDEFKKHKTQCLADTAPFPSPAAPPQLTTFISLLFNFFNFPSTITCLLFPPYSSTSFLLLSLLLLFIFYCFLSFPPRFHFPPPFLIYSFPSTTTTFLLFSLHHHHISNVFPPPPPHFIIFFATYTRQVIWKVRRPKPGQTIKKK